MRKRLIKRVDFFLTHPSVSIIKRIRDFNYKRKGIDFKFEFDLSKLGLITENSNGYESLEDIKRLKVVFKRLNISNNDSIIDLGCGKGEALFEIAKYPFKEIAGVELSDKLFSIVQNNFRILKRENIKLYHCDAGEFNDLDIFNVIYMFNPFPEVVMREVVLNIEQSLIRKPRVLTIIYCHPVCHDVITLSRVIIKTNEYSIKNKDQKLSIFVYKSR